MNAVSLMYYVYSINKVIVMRITLHYLPPVVLKLIENKVHLLYPDSRVYSEYFNCQIKK